MRRYLVRGTGRDYVGLYIRTPWDIGIGRPVELWETIGSSHQCEVVGLVGLQVIVRENRDPQLVDDKGDDPQPIPWPSELKSFPRCSKTET